MSGEHVSTFPIATPPKEWDKAALIAHLKTGMQIELGTLPLYFCALYSIKQGSGPWASSARMHILSVAEQEMLHLALAGNMLRALDSSQTLYSKDFMPTYPSKILFDKVDMKLQPANKENLDCFLRIEAPYMPQPILAGGGGSFSLFADIAPTYNSIGQFYKELETGIKLVAQKDPSLFTQNREMQFTGDQFFDSKMTVIVDKDSALTALETIVDQGEGSIGVPDSHYAIFVELYQQRKNWQTVDYIDEPTTDKYKDSKVAYQMSLAVNASYCYLLQTIDQCWMERSVARRALLLRNLHRLMIEILSPCAHVLVTLKVGLKYAAPCFEFYPPGPGEKPLSPTDLFRNLVRELEAAKGATSDPITKAAIEKILFCTTGLSPPA